MFAPSAHRQLFRSDDPLTHSFSPPSRGHSEASGGYSLPAVARSPLFVMSPSVLGSSPWLADSSVSLFDTTGVSTATVGRGAVRLADTSLLSSHADSSLAVQPVSPQPLSTRGEILCAVAYDPDDANATLEIPKLMQQTRLVSGKIAHIRSAHDKILADIYQVRQDDLRHSLPLGNFSPQNDSAFVTRRVEQAKLTDSQYHLSDALQAVARLSSDISNTRRLLLLSLERPLHQFKAAFHRAPAAADRASHKGPVSSSSHSSVALTFGEGELSLLKAELQSLTAALQSTERTILTALGVTQEPLCRQHLESGETKAYVVRRRAEADVAAVRAQVEAQMKSEKRFAPLYAQQENVKIGGVHRFDGKAMQLGAESSQRIAHALNEKFDVIHNRSQFEFEINRLESLITCEQANQLAAVEGKHGTPSVDGSAVENNTMVVSEPEVATVVAAVAEAAGQTLSVNLEFEKERSIELEDLLRAPSEDLDEATPHDKDMMPPPNLSPPQGDAAPHFEEFSEVEQPINEIDTSCALEVGATQPLPKMMDDVSGANVESQPDAADNETHPLPAAMTEQQAPDESLLEVGGPTPPVFFAERLKAWVQQYLVSSACSWISCTDSESGTKFYIDIQTGERCEDLKLYFTDTVAEVVAAELLDEGKRSNGWCQVSPDEVDDAEAQEVYYYHQISGETVWSLAEWVKEH